MKKIIILSIFIIVLSLSLVVPALANNIGGGTGPACGIPGAPVCVPSSRLGWMRAGSWAEFVNNHRAYHGDNAEWIATDRVIRSGVDINSCQISNWIWYLAVERVDWSIPRQLQPNFREMVDPATYLPYIINRPEWMGAWPFIYVGADTANFRQLIEQTAWQTTQHGINFYRSDAWPLTTRRSEWQAFVDSRNFGRPYKDIWESTTSNIIIVCEDALTHEFEHRHTPQTQNREIPRTETIEGIHSIRKTTAPMFPPATSETPEPMRTWRNNQPTWERTVLTDWGTWYNGINFANLTNRAQWDDLRSQSNARQMNDTQIRNHINLFAHYPNAMINTFSRGALYRTEIQTSSQSLTVNLSQTQQRTRLVPEIRRIRLADGAVMEDWHPDPNPCVNCSYNCGWHGGNWDADWGWSAWTNVEFERVVDRVTPLPSFIPHSHREELYAICVNTADANRLSAIPSVVRPRHTPTFYQVHSAWTSNPSQRTFTPNGNANGVLVNFELLTDTTPCDGILCVPNQLPSSGNDGNNNITTAPDGQQQGAQSNGMQARLFHYFRDNQIQDIRVNLWYPSSTCAQHIVNSNAPAVQTRITFDPQGTPNTSSFVLREIRPNNTRQQLIHGGELANTQILNQQVNRFAVSSAWASEAGRPHRWNISWLYEMSLRLNFDIVHGGVVVGQEQRYIPVNVQCDMRLNTTTPQQGIITPRSETFSNQPHPAFDPTGQIPTRGSPLPTDISHWIGANFVRAIRE